jgi:hypothetical protein
MEYKHTLINTQTDYTVVDFEIDGYRFYVAKHMLDENQQIIFDNYVNNLINYNYNIIINDIPLEYDCIFTVYHKDITNENLITEYTNKLLSDFSEDEINSFKDFIELCLSFKTN